MAAKKFYIIDRQACVFTWRFPVEAESAGEARGRFRRRSRADWAASARLTHARNRVSARYWIASSVAMMLMVAKRRCKNIIGKIPPFETGQFSPCLERHASLSSFPSLRSGGAE